MECLIERASRFLFLISEHCNSWQWHQSSPAESMLKEKKKKERKSLVRPPHLFALSGLFALQTCHVKHWCLLLGSLGQNGQFFLLSAPEADNTIAFHFGQMAFNWQIKQLMHSRLLPGYCCPSYKTVEETGRVCGSLVF